MAGRPVEAEVNGQPVGMASLSLGAGPPLLLLPGLTPDHEPPTGTDRWFQLRSMRRLAPARQVWWVNRRRGLSEGTTMADLAEDYATMLREWQAPPIDVVGVSTGGSVALQLAADHPQVVRRLVLVASGCRLGPQGHAGQRRAIEALERGDRRAAAAILMELTAAGRLTRATLRAVGWLVPSLVAARDTHDLRVTMQAEDAFDLADRLQSISAPTLVIGGDRDAYYGEGVFRETADALPFGHLVLLPGAGHAATVAHRHLSEQVDAFLGHR